MPLQAANLPPCDQNVSWKPKARYWDLLGRLTCNKQDHRPKGCYSMQLRHVAFAPEMLSDRSAPDL